MENVASKISKNTYTKKEMFGYLTGMFGQNVIYQIIAVGLISYYFQFVLFIPVQIISAITFAARIWDAFNDPMMGTIVDKTNSKWGKCRPYLIFFPIIISVMTVLCFINGRYTDPGANKTLVVAWAAASYIIWGMLFTVCDIPLWGITSLMTDDEEDRSKIIGLARIAAGFGGVGILVQFIPDMVKGLFEGKYNAKIGTMVNGFKYTSNMAENDTKRAAWIFTVIVMTVIAAALFEIAGLVTRERVPGQEKEKRNIIDNFKTMWNCKPFRQILISGIIRSPLQLLMLVAMPFMMFYYLDNDFNRVFGDVSLLLKVAIIGIAVFGGQFVAMGITPSLVKKYENKTIYNFYSIVGAVPFALIFVLYLLAKGDLTSLPMVIVTGVLLALAAAAMGGINVMQSIMIADCVDYEEYHNGNRPDGVFFSGQSFLTKLSGGIAALIQGGVYAFVGFSDDVVKDVEAALKVAIKHNFDGEKYLHFYQMNDGKYAMAMFFLISIPIAVGMLLSVIPTKNYAMSDAEHEKILEELVTKRETEVKS